MFGRAVKRVAEAEQKISPVQETERGGFYFDDKMHGFLITFAVQWLCKAGH